LHRSTMPELVQGEEAGSHNPHRTQRDVKSGVIWWATKLSNEDRQCGAAALHHGTPCYRTADVQSRILRSDESDSSVNPQKTLPSNAQAMHTM
jgi:hypothetical protein